MLANATITCNECGQHKLVTKCNKVYSRQCMFCYVFGFMSDLVWCVVAAIQSQWLSMKVLVHSQFRKKAYSDL